MMPGSDHTAIPLCDPSNQYWCCVWLVVSQNVENLRECMRQARDSEQGGRGIAIVSFEKVDVPVSCPQ
jgi:hypothetical protein